MGRSNPKKQSPSRRNPVSSVKMPSRYPPSSNSSQKTYCLHEVVPPKKKSTKASQPAHKKWVAPANDTSNEEEREVEGEYDIESEDEDEKEDEDQDEGEKEDEDQDEGKKEDEDQEEGEKEDTEPHRHHKRGNAALDDKTDTTVFHPLKAYHDGTRFIPCIIGPFARPMQALQLGLLLQQDDDDELDPQTKDTFSSMDDDEREELIYTFDTLLSFIPGLKDQLLNHYAPDARGDHLGSLRERIINYLPDFGAEYPAMKPQDSKWKCGFQSTTTVRLLCPQSMLAEFLNEPDNFCCQVRDGEIDTASDEFPSFLYDQALYNPDELDAGLLRGPLLLSCFKSLFTGPGSVLLNHGDREGRSSRPGHPPLAKKYDMTQVSPRSIAYVAVLVRFLLNSQQSWSNIDLNFDLEQFFFEILRLFQDEEWGQATLEWWNKAVFGTTAKTAKKKTRPQSAITKLKAQCAARAAVQSGAV
ncbi:hypothetical protein SCP_0900350 [Sparassis crispa]|uniref:Uncharacterized protein n=1 Tax=Sparassis crispa TaxID=139825 RepID=A0A401GVA8_9APHY|nr:hypothetical protein SCP_0900350 [Sparassis crispa]GBE86158.1 hypothetical protein SCP_0900350 [Sparassis crispa]